MSDRDRCETRLRIAERNLKDRMKAEKKLPFGHRSAQMLMRIAKNKVLSNARNFSHLPNCYRTLAALAKAPEIELEGWIRSGEVNPETSAEDVRRLLGWTDKDDMLKAISLLITRVRYVTSTELAGYWEGAPEYEDLGTLLGFEYGIDQLRFLSTYLTELHADLEARYETKHGRIHYGQYHVTKREKKLNKLKQELKKEEADAAASQTR